MKKERNKNKLNFFKRLYYSIFKIDKYEELSTDGLIKSIKYILYWLLILAIIYSSIIIIQTRKNMNNLKNYLDENLPELVYENDELTIENTERVVLDNKYIKANFGGQIIIDTTTDYDTLINEYKEKAEPSIILSKDYFTTINGIGMVEKKQYNEVIKEYLNNDIKKLDKEELLYLFDNFLYSQYLLAYIISYVIAHFIMVFLYCLFLTIICFIVCKIKKVKIKYVQIFAMGMYSMTISVFGYFISSIIPSFNISIIIRIASIIIATIYFIRAVYINKWMKLETISNK